MPRTLGVAVGIGVLFLIGWNCVACGSSTDSRPGPAVSAAGAPPSGSGSGGGFGLDLAGNGNGNGIGGGTGPNLSDACAQKISTARAVPLDMYLMLDVSGSMLDLTATQVTKWDAVKLALESFLTDTQSAGLGVGLQYFPLQKPDAPATCSNDAQCGDSAPCFLSFCFDYYQNALVACQKDSDCPVGVAGRRRCLPIAFCSADDTYLCPNAGGACEPPTGSNADLGICQAITESVCLNSTICDDAKYAAPATAIAALPGAAAKLVASIDAQSPEGDTPTGPALSGAIQQAHRWAIAHPDHRVITVLATDGLPTQCSPNTIDAVAALARAGVNDSPSISTFVIGVFGPDDVANGAQANLDQIAQQGGTNKAFIVNTQKDVTAQFQEALDAIRGARLACQYQIPEPTSGGTLDYGRVNVALTNAGQQQVIYYVKNQAGCDPNTGGWYYDIEPAVGTPTKIIACPTTCSAFEAAASGASVGIALDCATIIK